MKLQLQLFALLQSLSSRSLSDFLFSRSQSAHASVFMYVYFDLRMCLSTFQPLSFCHCLCPCRSLSVTLTMFLWIFLDICHFQSVCLSLSLSLYISLSLSLSLSLPLSLSLSLYLSLSGLNTLDIKNKNKFFTFCYYSAFRNLIFKSSNCSFQCNK